jgi:SAM-dependent methyltransferase
MDDVITQDRLERERQFHNERFEADETRVAQDKYYWALADCNKRLEALVTEKAAGARVLDYGCALGESSLRIAPIAARVDGIDISDVAIARAQDEANSRGFTNAFFHAMDAHATTFEDDTFDLVFGSGIIHHLDTRKSLQEIHRVLKPGGLALFQEPLGGNIGINLYRALTPSTRTPDEHPLLPVDEAIARSIFSEVDWDFYGLFTLASVPLRNSAAGSTAYRITAGLDRWVGKTPGIRWQSWYALLSMRK